MEEVAASWILELLDLPRHATVGFATGATVGNFVALAAARGATLRKHNRDPDTDGLFGAPEVHVFIGDDAHTSVFSALQYIGFGRDRVIRVETNSQGRMKSDDLELNQVIVEFGAADESLESRREQTQAVIDTVVDSGTCFVGGARWRDRWVMRISVISQNTSVEDGNIAVDAMIKAWRQVRGSSPVDADI